jgi:hypothetical protein
VDLVQVHIVGAETPQRSPDGLGELLRMQTTARDEPVALPASPS